jgi:hypothetical protein
MVYEEITDLEDISIKAKEKIGSDAYLINFDLKVTFKKNLINNCMSSVYQDALDFQNPVCPDTLHMNHGEYIHKCGDGINNVINQLKEKHASNRAIISLINQENIMESKDTPIPSFMILQFSIEDSTKLYLTTYFRALEVSKFLRINTEEIRQIIEKILAKNIQLNEIYLNIFAFRAYIDLDINPLKKPKIDTYDKQDILKYLLKEQSNLNELIELLNEKNTSSTVIRYLSFQNIIDWINDSNFNSIIHSDLKKPLVNQYFKEIVDILVELEKLREQTSHNELIDEKQKLYKNNLNQLIKVLRNDS